MTLVNSIGVSGKSSTGDNESSMEGARRKLRAAKYHGDWEKVTRHRGQQWGHKARAR